MTFRDIAEGLEYSRRNRQERPSRRTSFQPRVPNTPRVYNEVIGSEQLDEIREQAARRGAAAESQYVGRANQEELFGTRIMNDALGVVGGLGQALDYIGQPIRMGLTELITEIDFTGQDYRDAFSFNDQAIAARHPEVTPTGEMRVSELFTYAGWDPVDEEEEGEGFFGEAAEQGERVLRFAAATIPEILTDPVNYATGGLKTLGQVGANSILKVGFRRAVDRVGKAAIDEGSTFVTRSLDDLVVDGRAATNFERDVARSLQNDLKVIDTGFEFKEMPFSERVGAATGVRTSPEYLQKAGADISKGLDDVEALAGSTTEFRPIYTVNGKKVQNSLVKQEFQLAENISRKQFHNKAEWWRNYTSHALDDTIDNDLNWTATTGGLAFMVPLNPFARPHSLGFVTKRTQGLASRFTRGSIEEPRFAAVIDLSKTATALRDKWRSFRKTKMRGQPTDPLRIWAHGTPEERIDRYFAFEAYSRGWATAKSATIQLAQEVHETSLHRTQEIVIHKDMPKLTDDGHALLREEIGNAWAGEVDLDVNALRQQGVPISDDAAAVLNDLNKKSRIKFHEYAQMAAQLDPEGFGQIYNPHLKYSPITLADELRSWMQENPRGMIAISQRIKLLLEEGGMTTNEAITVIGKMANIDDLDPETLYQFIDLTNSVKLRGGSMPGPEQIGDAEILRLRSVGAGAFVVVGEDGNAVVKAFQDIGALNEKFTKLFNYYGREADPSRFPKKGIQGVLVTDPALSIKKWKSQMLEAVQDRIHKDLMSRAGFLWELSTDGKALLWGRWAYRNVDELNFLEDFFSRLHPYMKQIGDNEEIPEKFIDDVIRESIESDWREVTVLGRKIRIPQEMLNDDKVVYAIDQLLKWDGTMRGANKGKVAMIRRAIQNAGANGTNFDLEIDRIIEATVTKRWRGYMRQVKSSMRKRLLDNMGVLQEAMSITGERPELAQIIDEWTDRYLAQIYDELDVLDVEFDRLTADAYFADLEAQNFKQQIAMSVDQATDDFVDKIKLHKKIEEAGYKGNIDIETPEDLGKFMDLLEDIHSSDLQQALAQFLETGGDAGIKFREVIDSIELSEMHRLSLGRTSIPTVMVDEPGKLVAHKVGWTIPNVNQAHIWVEYWPGMGGIEFVDGKPHKVWPESDQPTQAGKNVTTWKDSDSKEYGNFAANMGWVAKDSDEVGDWYADKFVEVVPGLMKFIGGGSMPFYVVGDIYSPDVARHLNQAMHEIWLAKYGPAKTKRLIDPDSQPLKIWGMTSTGRYAKEYRTPKFMEDLLGEEGFLAYLMKPKKVTGPNGVVEVGGRQYMNVWDFWRKWAEWRFARERAAKGEAFDWAEAADKPYLFDPPGISFNEFYAMVEDMVVARPKLTRAGYKFDEAHHFKRSAEYVPVPAQIINIDNVKKNDDIARSVGIVNPENLNPIDLYEELVDMGDDVIGLGVAYPFEGSERMAKPIYDTDQVDDIHQIKYSTAYVNWLIAQAEDYGMLVDPRLAAAANQPARIQAHGPGPSLLHGVGRDYENPLVDPMQINTLEAALTEVAGVPIRDLWQTDVVAKPIGYETLPKPPQEVVERVMALARELWPRADPKMKDFDYWWERVKAAKGGINTTEREMRRFEDESFYLYDLSDLDPTSDLIENLRHIRSKDNPTDATKLLPDYQKVASMFAKAEMPGFDTIDKVWLAWVEKNYPGAWAEAKASRLVSLERQIENLDAQYGKALRRRERRLWESERKRQREEAAERPRIEDNQSVFDPDDATAWREFLAAAEKSGAQLGYGQQVAELTTLLRDYQGARQQMELFIAEEIDQPQSTDVFEELMAVIFRDKYYDGDIDAAYQGLNDMQMLEAQYGRGAGMAQDSDADFLSAARTPMKSADDQIDYELREHMTEEDWTALEEYRNQLEDRGDVDPDLIDDADGDLAAYQADPDGFDAAVASARRDPLVELEEMGADIEELGEVTPTKGRLSTREGMPIEYERNRSRSNVRSEQLYGAETMPRAHAITSFTFDEMLIDLGKLAEITGGPIPYPHAWISPNRRNPTRLTVRDQLNANPEYGQKVSQAGLTSHQIDEHGWDSGAVDVHLDEQGEPQRTTADPRRYGVEQHPLNEEIIAEEGLGIRGFQTHNVKGAARKAVFEQRTKTFLDQQAELRRLVSRVAASPDVIRRRAFQEVFTDRQEQLGAWVGFVQSNSGREAAGLLGIDLAAALETHRRFLINKNPQVLADQNYLRMLALGAAMEEAGFLTTEGMEKVIKTQGFKGAQALQKSKIKTRNMANLKLADELRDGYQKKVGPDFSVAEKLRTRQGEARRKAGVLGTRVLPVLEEVTRQTGQTRFMVIGWKDLQDINKAIDSEIDRQVKALTEEVGQVRPAVVVRNKKGAVNVGREDFPGTVLGERSGRSFGNPYKEGQSRTTAGVQDRIRFNRDYEALEKRVLGAEKASDPSTWTVAERAASEAGDWRTFSKLRGYTPEEIEDFGRLHGMTEGLEPNRLVDYPEGSPNAGGQAQSTDPDTVYEAAARALTFDEALQQWDTLPGGTRIEVYHSTTPEIAERLQAEGIVGENKVLAEYSTVKTGEGLYVSADPDRMRFTYGGEGEEPGTVIGVTVNKGQIIESNEGYEQGYTLDAAAHDPTIGAVVLDDIPAEDIRILGAEDIEAKGRVRAESEKLTVEEAVENYEIYLRAEVQKDPLFAEDVQALAGKKLYCPGKHKGPCHANVLAEVANELAGVPKPKPIQHVDSGGQRGADRLGIEIGQMLGAKTGGVAPRDYLIDAGPGKGKVSDPTLKDFGLVEDTSPGYRERTIKNVKNNDGTVLFTVPGKSDSPGSKLTKSEASKAGKPWIENPTPEEFGEWVETNQIKRLNIAGNREYTDRAYMLSVLEPYVGKHLTGLEELEALPRSVEAMDWSANVGRDGPFGGNAFIAAIQGKSGKPPRDLAYKEGAPHPYLMEPVYEDEVVINAKGEIVGYREPGVEKSLVGFEDVKEVKRWRAGGKRKQLTVKELRAVVEPRPRQIVAWRPVRYQAVATEAEARSRFAMVLWRQLEGGEALDPSHGGLIGDDLARWLVETYEGKMLYHIGDPDVGTHAQIMSDAVDWLKSPFWTRYRKSPLKYDSLAAQYLKPAKVAKRWEELLNESSISKVERWINDLIGKVDDLTAEQVIKIEHHQRLGWMLRNKSRLTELFFGEGAKSTDLQPGITSLNAAMNKVMPNTHLTTFYMSDGSLRYRLMAPGSDFAAFDEYFGLRGLRPKEMSESLKSVEEMGYDAAVKRGLDISYDLAMIVRRKEAMRNEAIDRAAKNARATYRRRMKKWDAEEEVRATERMRIAAEREVEKDRMVAQINADMDLMSDVFDVAWKAIRTGDSKPFIDLIGPAEKLTDQGVALQRAMVGLTDFQKDNIEFLLQAASMAGKFTEVHGHKEWMNYFTTQRAGKVRLAAAMEEILDGMFSLKNKPGPRWQEHVDFEPLVKGNVEQAQRALSYLLGKLHNVDDPNSFVPPHMRDAELETRGLETPSFPGKAGGPQGPNLNKQRYEGPYDAILALSKTLEEIEKHRFLDQLINIRGFTISEADKSRLHQIAESLRVRAEEMVDMPDPGGIRADQLGLGGIYANTVLNEAVGYEMMKASIRRQIMARADQNLEVLGLTQKLSTLWMKAATIGRLGFHQRNLISVFWNNLYLGVSAKDTAAQGKDALRFVQNMRRLRYMEYGELTDLHSTTAALLDGIEQKELYLRLIESGAVQSAFASQIPRHTRRGIKRQLGRAFPLHHDFALFDYGSDAMMFVEMVGRAAAFKKFYDPRMPEFTSMIGKRMTDVVHFDYTDLGQWEMAIKPWVPFWTWTARNIPLQMRALMESPRYMNMYFKAQANWNLNYGEQDDPEDAEAVRGGAWLLPFRRDDTNGDWVQAVWKPALPFMDIMDLPLFADGDPDPDTFVSRVSPMEWIGWATGQAAPQFKFLFDQSEKGDVRMAPRMWNEVAYAAGLGSEEGLFGTGMGSMSRSLYQTPQGDVRIPKPLEALLRIMPHWNEYQDLAGVESNNPYTVSNQGLLPGEASNPDVGWEDTAAMVIGSQLGEGFGFQWTGPEDIYWHYYDLNAYYEDLESIGKATAPAVGPYEYVVPEFPETTP